MSITLTITAIAASLALGTYEGRRRQREQGIRPTKSDDIDSCITVYPDELRCDCMEEHLLDVDVNMRGQPICGNCGRRRV